MGDIIGIAEKAEDTLNTLLADDGFSLSSARLYGVTLGGEEGVMLSLLSEHPDVYDLLESKKAKLALSFDFIGVVTTGWAAPLNENGEVEGAPSQHAERRRVRLMVIADKEGVASVLRFADTPDEVVTDPGSATGSLADAIQKLVQS
jgi:hypothetical protein